MKSAPQCGSVRFCSPIVRPTSCYASTNRRSRQATYQAVCGKRTTLLSNGDQSRRMGGTGQAAGMLRGQVFGPGGNTTSRVIGSTGGECGQLRRRHSGKGRAVPERLPVDPYFVMRALSVAKASRSLCGAVANGELPGEGERVRSPCSRCKIPSA